MVTWSSCPQSSKNIMSSNAIFVSSLMFSKCLYLASPPFLPICSTTITFEIGCPGKISRFSRHAYELIGIGDELATPILTPCISGAVRMYLKVSSAPGKSDTVWPSLLRIPQLNSLPSYSFLIISSGLLDKSAISGFHVQLSKSKTINFGTVLALENFSRQDFKCSIVIPSGVASPMTPNFS